MKVAVPQHSKGKKRPRRWHHSRAEGRRARSPISEIEQATARAERTDAELARTAAELAEEVELWQGLARVAPIVLSIPSL